jgi:hypothetical protein
MGKAKRGKLSRQARHDPVGLAPSLPKGTGAAASGGGGAAAGAGGGGKAERVHVLLQEVGGTFFFVDST